MLNKNVSVIRYKEDLAKKEEKTNKEALEKLAFILDDKRTFSTNRVVDLFLLINNMENLTDKQIKKSINYIYSSLKSKGGTKKHE